MRLQIFRLPRYTEWLVGRLFVLITVAGPRRTHTGFPVMPSRAPEMSGFDNSTNRRNVILADSRSVPARLVAGLRAVFGWKQRSQRAAGTAHIPDLAIEPEIRERQWRDVKPPKCRQRQLQSIDNSTTDHCWMRHCHGVRYIALLLQPASHPSDQPCYRLTSMRCRGRVGQPRAHSLRVFCPNIVHGTATPCTVIAISQLI